MKSKIILLVAALTCGSTMQAQHIDEVLFGNTASEKIHGLTTYNPNNTKTYTGLLNQTARTFMMDTSNPFQGDYTGIYGGEVFLTVKVDGTAQNYFTVKFAGNESSNERVLLDIEGKEVGQRHGNEDFFFGEIYNVCPEVFCFKTISIPRSLTDGKSQVTVRLRSTGRFYGYGTSGNYATFQRAMTSNTMGLFKLYVHTDPGFVISTSELNGGVAPSYSAASVQSYTLAQFKVDMQTEANKYFNGILNGPDYILTDNNNYFQPIEALAVAYWNPDISATYFNSTVIDKLKILLDNTVRSYYNSINNSTNPISQSPTACWGGAYGRQGYALLRIWDYIDLKYWDNKIDLGAGSGKTRREQYIAAFKASFNAGASSRKSITNQLMENDQSVYGAAMILNLLDPATYANYRMVGYSLLRESCGLDEYTGAVTGLNSNSPTLGTPANSDRGAGYYFMTKKGTSHEPGWVSADCYGNLGDKLIGAYEMTIHDSKVAGDKEILQRSIDHCKSQCYFTIPFIDPNDSKRAMTTEGYTCWRNVYVPGKTYYGTLSVPGITDDATLLGYMMQCVKDGRLTYGETNIGSVFKMTNTQYIFNSVNELINHGSKYTAVIPTTPGQPNFLFTDPENGIVSFKQDTTQMFVNFYYRDYANNQLAHIHLVTPSTQRFVETKVTNEYRKAGAYMTRDDNPNGVNSTYGTVPDSIHSAMNGVKEYYASYDGTSKYDENRQLKDYYFVKYSKFIVVMNTMTSTQKTITFPAEVVGKSATLCKEGEANSMVTIPSTMDLPAQTTYVLVLADAGNVAGLQSVNANATNANKTALNDTITKHETFAQQASTCSNISLDGVSGIYRQSNFLNFMRALSNAEYVNANAAATQTSVDSVLIVLNKSYTNLTTDVTSYTSVGVPGNIPYTKNLTTGGSIKVTSSTGVVDCTKNGAYLIIPVVASATGDYKFTINASTVTSLATQNPRLNLAMLDESNYKNATLDATKTQSIIPVSDSWNDYSSYTWRYSMTAGETKLLKLTFLIDGAGWCINTNSLKATLCGNWDYLQNDIDSAQVLYNTYNEEGTFYYSMVSSESKAVLLSAINAVKLVKSTVTDVVALEARNILATAVATFKSSICSYPAVPGPIDMLKYISATGTIKVSDSDYADCTTNNNTLTYQLMAGESGNYIPYVIASTNVDATSHPRISMAIALKDSALVDGGSNWTVYVVKSINDASNGWNNFATYSYPEVTLEKGSVYTMRLTFNVDETAHWCANIKGLGLNHQKADAIQYINADALENPCTVYLYNLSGRLVKIFKSEDGHSVIDIEGQPSGVYIVKMQNDTVTKTIKFIKKLLLSGKTFLDQKIKG